MDEYSYTVLCDFLTLEEGGIEQDGGLNKISNWWNTSGDKLFKFEFMYLVFRIVSSGFMFLLQK